MLAKHIRARKVCVRKANRMAFLEESTIQITKYTLGSIYVILLCIQTSKKSSLVSNKSLFKYGN